MSGDSQAAEPSNRKFGRKPIAPSQGNGGLVQKSAISLVLKILGAGVAFAMNIVLGRELGADAAGLFFLAIAVVTLLSAIARMGFDQAVTKFVAEAHGRSDFATINGIYQAVNLRILAASIALATLLFTSAPAVSQRVFQTSSLTPVLQIMAWSLPGFSMAWIHAHFFQGLDHIKKFQWFQTLGVATTFLILYFGMGCTVDKPGVILASSCYLAASTACALSAAFLWRRDHRLPCPSKSVPVSKSVLAVTHSMFGISIVSYATLWLPQLVLGAFYPSREVAIYNASFRTATLTSIALLGVNSVFFPRFASLNISGNQAELQRLCQISTAAMVAVCAPFLIVLLAIPATVLGAFGPEFEAGAPVLRILSVGQFINVATGSVGGLLVMTGYQKTCLRASMTSFLVLTVLLLLLVPAAAASGAAISQVVALSLNMALLSVSCYRLHGFAPLGGLALIISHTPYTRPARSHLEK